MNHEQENLQNAWDNIAAGYDEFVTPTHMWLAAEALRRVGLRSGMMFLDVAAGSGALSIPAARMGAHVLSIDISPSMITGLKARAQRENISLNAHIMDGHALDLEDSSFDIVGSQFGVMLFPHKAEAIREMLRVTRPGGRVLMTVYGAPQQIEFLSFFVGALQSVAPHFTGLPMEPLPLPFELQDPKRLHDEITKVGWKDVNVDRITEQLEFGSGQDLWNWVVNSNPIARGLLRELNISDDAELGVQQALERMIRKRAGSNGKAVLTNPINIGIGTK